MSCDRSVYSFKEGVPVRRRGQKAAKLTETPFSGAFVSPRNWLIDAGKVRFWIRPKRKRDLFFGTP